MSTLLQVLGRVSAQNDDTTVCHDQAGLITLPVTGVQSYHNLSWQPATGLSCTDCSNPTTTITQSTLYTLNVSDDFGCFDGTYSFRYNVTDGAFKMPNAFTPDGDGTNDYFNLVTDNENNFEILEVTRFEVFNRWGQKVYDNDTPGQGWDGMQNGKPAASDVYIYIIETAFSGCPGTEFRGNVTLIR
jgi:gliding motility-associated-like protein